MLKEGDTIILYGGPNTIYKIILEKGKLFASKCGNLLHSDIIGNFDYGSQVKTSNTNKSKYLIILKPSSSLLSLSMEKRTQIIFPHDIAAILVALDVRPGKHILEVGTGSGSLTCAMAFALRGFHEHSINSESLLTTVELDLDRHEKAKSDISNLGLSHIVKCLHGEATTQNFKSNIFDAIFIDIPSPELTLSKVVPYLREGGRIAIFMPCIENAQKIVLSLESSFYDVRTYEFIPKEWGLIKKNHANVNGISRNFKEHLVQRTGRSHTAYITVATKYLYDEKSFPQNIWG